MAISALYELFEWLIAEIIHQGATAFLGTQGDIWDTQKDMLWCLIGCTVMLTYLYSNKHRLSANSDYPSIIK